MRKNGRKWSNISVKKYHQSPGFGVKSGKVNLRGDQFLLSVKGIKRGVAYTEPQLCSTQDQLPQTTVEATVRAEKSRMNWPNNGMAARMLPEKGRGVDSRENGPESMRNMRGTTKITDGSEIWTCNARNNNEAEERPRTEHQSLHYKHHSTDGCTLGREHEREEENSIF